MVVHAAKILGRLLVLSGPSYMQKYVDKSGGMIIMKHRFQRFWNVPAIWLVCFAILFGKDLASVNFESTFDLFNLLQTFAPNAKTAAVYPEILPVITAMLRSGLLHLNEVQPKQDVQLMEKTNGSNGDAISLRPASHARQRSLTLSVDMPKTCKLTFTLSPLVASTDTL